MPFRCDRAACLLFAVTAAAALSGCAGYQIGNASLYRGDVRTVCVPMFESDSFRRNLGERLTEAVVKRIEEVTPYKVVGSDVADSILGGRIVDGRIGGGRIVSDTKHVLAENRDGEPRHLETGLAVQVSWTDRRGNLLGPSGNAPLLPILLTVDQSTSFVPEAGQSFETARQLAIERLARQIVAQMEMPW